MRIPILALVFLAIVSWVGASPVANARLIILADMGNEPDEEQQIAHLLLYANEFEIEGLIAVTGKFLRSDPQPELFFNLIDGYDLVLPNLRVHAEGWPDAGSLQAVVRAGQRRYGIADTGKGKQSPGSRLIAEALQRDDPRPLYFVVNAGSNTLAQALLDLESELSPEEFSRVLTKFRVFENGAQDNAGAWIMNRWPGIRWIRSNYQTYAYGGPSIDGGRDNRGKGTELGPHTWEPYAYSGIGQHQWALEHIKGGHGALLALWPIRQFRQGGVSFVEGGGTIPWLCLVNKGLSDFERPEWGGWSGRFSRKPVEDCWSKHGDVRIDEEPCSPFAMIVEEADTWVNPENGDRYEDNLFAPVWRWRRAFFNDFAARADWCVKPFDEANHNPVAAIDGDRSDAILRKVAIPGEVLHFDATGSSDPDGDALQLSWFVYPEAGTYGGTVVVQNGAEPVATVNVPGDTAGSEIHLILEVRDRSGIVPLFDYRRVVITVSGAP